MARNREFFQTKIVEYELEILLPEFDKRRINTMAKFAYGCEYTPACEDQSKLTEFLTSIAGGADEHLGMLRMLWWNSWGTVAAELSQDAELTVPATSQHHPAGATQPSTQTTRKHTNQEIALRRKRVWDEIGVGMILTEETDVSDRLIQDCLELSEANRLLYIPWERCTRRSMEEVGGNRKPDEGEDKANIQNVLQIDNALRRRGLAMAMADIMSWPVHEQIRSALVRVTSLTPPPGYRRTSFEQIRCADRALFGVLAKQVEISGIRRSADALPLDNLVPAALANWEVTIHMQPLPETGAGPQERKRKPDQSTSVGSQKKGRGKGAKNQGKRPAGPGKNVLPQGLRGEHNSSITRDGKTKCFNFNLDRCPSRVKAGDKCDRGLHVCIDSRCEKPHAFCRSH